MAGTGTAAVAAAPAAGEGPGNVYRWPEREKVIRFGHIALPFYVPSKDDPRLIEIAALIVAVTLRVAIIHQGLTVPQVVAAIGTAIGLDLLLTLIRRQVLIAPASAIISGLIITLIIRSDVAWPFALAAAIAILSKHLIRTPERHIFNPSVLGLTIVLATFPHVAYVSLANWDAAFFITPALVIGGALATKKADALEMLPGFMPVYILLFVIGTLAQQGSAVFHSPQPVFHSLGNTLYLAHYTFVTFEIYLLTDPRTAPRSDMGRIVYAAIVGVIGAGLLLAGMQRMLALLIGLLICNLLAVLVLNRVFPYTGKKVKIKPDLPFGPKGGKKAKPKTRTPSVPPSAAKTPVPQAPAANPRVEAAPARPAPELVEPPKAAPSPAVTPAVAPVASAAQEEMPPANLNAVTRIQNFSVQAFLASDGDDGAVYALEEAETTIGRAADNTIKLEMAGVSRYHARITYTQEGSYMLSDLGSSNGTFVNDERIDGPVELHDADRVRFGGRDQGATVNVHLKSTRSPAGPAGR